MNQIAKHKVFRAAVYIIMTIAAMAVKGQAVNILYSAFYYLVFIAFMEEFS